MHAQAGRTPRLILNRITISLGLVLMLATIAGTGVAVHEFDLPFIEDVEDGESAGTSDLESRMSVPENTAWDYGDIETDLQLPATSGFAEPADRPSTLQHPAANGANVEDHRSTTSEELTNRAAASRNQRLQELNAAGPQDLGSSDDGPKELGGHQPEFIE